MKRLFHLILVTGLAWPMMMAAQTTQWTRYQPAGQDFSILFPGTPTVDPPSTENDSKGALQSTSYLYRINGNGYFYGAVLTVYTFTPSSIDGELAANQNNFIKALSGSVLNSSTRGNFVNGSETLPDLTFTFDVPQTNQYGKSIVILKGNRVYMWVAMITKNTMDASLIDTFVNSFQFAK